MEKSRSIPTFTPKATFAFGDGLNGIHRNTSEASKPPTSSSTISDVVVVEKVRQAIPAEFVKGSEKFGVDPNLHLCSSAVGATSETSTRPYSLIDLVTSSAVTSISAPTVIPSSPVSVASTPSNPGNGGNASGFHIYCMSPTHIRPHRFLRPPRGNPKNLHVSSAEDGECSYISILGASLPSLYGWF